jgi:hypothetical protein
MPHQYRLYRWEFTPWGLMTRPKRGRLLDRFNNYHDLVESAMRRARLAGYYDDHDWQYLFDWEKLDGKTQTIRTRGTNNQHPSRPDNAR